MGGADQNSGYSLLLKPNSNDGRSYIDINQDDMGILLKLFTEILDTMETQITELEKEYWQAMQNHDFDTIKRLTRFPCLVAGKNGIRQVDEASFKAMFDSSENTQLKVIEISSPEVQVIHEQIGLIAYPITVEYLVGGEKTIFNCVCTSTWVKEDDHWICAMHTETESKK